MLISGEPGIGKTRLADELAAEAAQRGAVVAWGAAWDGGGAPAYWPWIQVVRALRPLVPAPDEQRRRDLGPLWDDAGGEAAPDAHPRAPDAGLQDPEWLRFRRFDALRAVLETAAHNRPLVVILEDLHAADRGSLLALQFVARGVHPVPLLLLATHRDTESHADAAAGELLAQLARAGTSLPLDRLGRAEVAHLMAGSDAVPPELLDEVFQASGGNPLFVDESMRLVRTGGRLAPIPAGLSRLLRERLARFEPSTREALATAALLGREFDLDVLADACAVSAPEIRTRLRAPRLAGVIEETSDAAARFAHGLYRERLIEDLAQGERAAGHLRVAQALLRQRAAGHLEAEEPLARHLLAACPQGDVALAIEWAVRAGKSARGAAAFDRAATLLEGARAALAHLPPDQTRQIDIEIELAEALVRTGAGARSRALCLAAAGAARQLGDPDRLARAALAYGAELRIAVVDPILVALLEEALAALEATPAAASAADSLRLGLRVRVMARLAAAKQPAPDPQVPIGLARAAIALARGLKDPETLLVTLHSAGSALVDYAAPRRAAAAGA